MTAMSPCCSNRTNFIYHGKMEQATAIALKRTKYTADRAGKPLLQCVPQECDVTFATSARVFNLLIFTATSSGSR